LAEPPQCKLPGDPKLLSDFIYSPICIEVRFGSLAVVRRNITPMAAFGRIADIERPTGGHKKNRHMAGFLVFLAAAHGINSGLDISS